MDEKPDEIMNHIESQRDELGRNLNELESRVKRSTDWRAQFDRNPMLMMGVALGGGLLLGSIVGRSRDRSSKTSWSSSPRSYNATSSGLGAASGYATPPSTSSSPTMRTPMGEHRRKSSDTLEHMKAALIAFATAKAKEFMSEALPGFNQHLEEAQQRRSSSHDPFAENNPGYPGSSSYQSGSETGSQQGNVPSGTPRTEQSFNTPYKQEPVGAHPSRNT